MWERCQSVTALAAALVLLIAGAAKIVNPSPPEGLDLPLWVFDGLPVFEIALGGWLISRRWLSGSWFVATVVFVIFLGFSLLLAMSGRTSCGCFGKAAVNPWLTFGLDLVLVAALIRFRPTWSGLPARNEVLAVARVAGIAAVMVVALTGVAVALFGSVAAAGAFLRGDVLVADPPVVDFGSGPVGGTIEGPVTLNNFSDRPVQIVGGTSSCSCVATYDLPVVLAPGKAASVGVKVWLPDRPRRFEQTVVSRTDAGPVKVRVRGMAEEKWSPGVRP